MTTTSPACRRLLWRDRDRPILAPMTTPPRWLRERRRVARAAASPESLAAEIARRVEAERDRTMWKGPIDWGIFRDVPDDEWEPFMAALEEAKGRPLLR
jgi:hypothetical protein